MKNPEMPTGDGDLTPNSWISEPPFVLFRFLKNEAAVAGLARNGVMVAEFSPWLFEAASRGVKRSDKSVVAALKKLAEVSQEPSGFARGELASGFQTLSAHSAIALWAGIETAIEQSLLNHLRELPDAKSIIAGSAPTLKTEKLQFSTEANARRALRRWEAAMDSPDSIDRALTMLADVGLVLDLPVPARRLLSEMAEVRNVLLHRGGLVDDWFVTKCGWLGLKPGERLIVDEQKLAKFAEAASIFAIAFAGAAIRSPYLVSKQPR